MTLTMSYAKTDRQRPVDNDDRFDMTFDMRRLAAKLDLTAYQMEAVEVIQNSFSNEMLTASATRGHERRAKVHQTVRKNLDNNQFRTYAMLLGTTLHNRGL